MTHDFGKPMPKISYVLGLSIGTIPKPDELFLDILRQSYNGDKESHGYGRQYGSDQYSIFHLSNNS